MICDYPQVFWKSVFEVFCQTPKTGLISICLLHMDVQPSTKNTQLQGGGEGAKQPSDKDFAHGSRWGLRPYHPSYRIYGWMTLTKMWVPICLYCSNCTKFGQLMLRKIIKIVATRCQIKMHQIRFRLGLRPRPRWGSLQRSPRPPTWIWDPTSKGRGGQGRGGEGREW